jgi:hypothetical protein
LTHPTLASRPSLFGRDTKNWTLKRQFVAHHSTNPLNSSVFSLAPFGTRVAFVSTEYATCSKEYAMAYAEKIALNSRISILGWYRILRAHHQWAMFQAIRYALWLAR